MVAKIAGDTAPRAYDAIDLAFQDLASGRIAGVVVETPVAARYALRLPRYREAFKVVGQPLTDENYGLVVKKGNRVLVETLNAALAKTKATGTLGELAVRWLR